MELLKRYLNVCFSGLLLCWLIAISGRSYAGDGVDTLQKLRFAAFNIQEPPFIYTDPLSEYQGIVPSIMSVLTRELALELEYVFTPRKGLESSIIKGQTDVSWLSPAWAVNIEQLLFTKPIFIYSEFLYGLSPFKEGGSVEDWVKGKSICVRENYQYPNLEHFFAQNISQAVRVSSQGPLINLLFKNRCDLVYMNEHRAQWMLASLSINQQVFRSHAPIHQANVALVFNKNWRNVMPRINQALTKIKESGELEKILNSISHSTELTK